ncbi:uncharacterized protein LOC132985382 [Labrus mixtus]|uniref:uncharacterized protein LOC132985382 n=1 Tax=Labrus mixtus TaxID=508554 RepID=UPI0029BFC90A|nr:uncharacterized protein LOC132985382 [Labrus mixtus]
MIEPKWVPFSVFLSALLQLAAGGNQTVFVTVRDGGEVALPCDNAIDGQQECDGTSWDFNGLTITRGGNAESDRLSVTGGCSLLIKEVTWEDVGHYVCHRLVSEVRQPPGALVSLSVVTKTNHYVYKSRYESLQCEVTDGYEVQLFPFRLQPSVRWRLIIVLVGLSALMITVVTVNRPWACWSFVRHYLKGDISSSSSISLNKSQSSSKHVCQVSCSKSTLILYLIMSINPSISALLRTGCFCVCTFKYVNELCLTTPPLWKGSGVLGAFSLHVLLFTVRRQTQRAEQTPSCGSVTHLGEGLLPFVMS